jgi:hypothetical protein
MVIDLTCVCRKASKEWAKGQYFCTDFKKRQYKLTIILVVLFVYVHFCKGKSRKVRRGTKGTLEFFSKQT